MQRINKIEHELKKYGQLHLLDFCEKLEEKEKKKFLDDLFEIDYELINSLYEKTNGNVEKREDKITAIDYIDKYKLNEKYKDYEEIGKKAIKEGKLAAVTMAGGQGTRLRACWSKRYL